MISEKMKKALNEQLNREIYSAYLYMSMAAHSTHIGLKGFANWFDVQRGEEFSHAMKIYEYLNDQDVKVVLGEIQKPQGEFSSPLEMFEKTLEHEGKVTRWINKLVKLAMGEEDHATQIFLQWFVSEQVEEEANDREIIDRLRLVGESGAALFMVDGQLAARSH